MSRPFVPPASAEPAAHEELRSGTIEAVARSPGRKSAPRAGDQLGRWTLTVALGAGAFGATWAATDELGREAAVKLLDLPPGDEVRALGSLCHPAIPALFEAQSWPQPFIAMERACGRSLDTMVRAKAAPEAAALRVLAVLVDALALVHNHGLAHGDIKTDNIIVERISDQRVWLVDFGMVGGVGGTLHYAAPERVRGEPPSGPADIYAAGVVLYEMLHGALPWAAEGLSASLALRRQCAPPVSQGSEWVRALLTEMLAPEPALRPSASAVVDVLEAHAVPLPRIDGATIRRRGRTAHVPRADVEAATQRWLKRGGLLHLLGAPGVGRTHALRRTSLELQARGLPHLRVTGGGLPWAAVQAALIDPALPGAPGSLPSCEDVHDRVDQAVTLIARRAPEGLLLLVDDLELLPAVDRDVVSRLSQRRGVRAVFAGSEPGEGACVTLTPFSLPEVDALLGVLLGGPPPSGLAEQLHERCFGMPKALTELVARAADAGALRRRSGAWLSDAEAIERLCAAWEQEGGGADRLAPEVREIAVMMALIDEACSPELIGRLAPALAEQLPRHLRAMAETGLLQAGPTGALRLTDAALGRRVVVSATAEQRERVARVLLSRGDWRSSGLGALRLLRHLCGARSAALAAELGLPLLEAVRATDAQAAAEAAAALWSFAPSDSLAPAVVRALSVGGRSAEARALGQDLLESGRASPALAIELARAAVDVDRDGAGALRCLQPLAGSPEAQGLVATSLRAGALALLGEHEAVLALSCAVVERQPPAEPADQVDAYLDVLRVHLRSLTATGRATEAEQQLEQLSEGLGRGRPARALVECVRGLVVYRLGRLRDAAKVYEAVAADDSGLPMPMRAQMINNAAVLSYQCGDRQLALSRWEAALLRFERLDDAREQARVRCNLCVAYGESGRWERARASGEAAHAAALRLPDWPIAAMSAGNLGDLAMAQSQVGVARGWFEVAQRLATEHALDGELVELGRRRAELAVTAADPDAVALCAEAMRQANQAGDEVEAAISRMLGLLARTRAEGGSGDARATLDEVDAIIQFFSETGHTTALARARLIGAEALLLLGQTERAARAIEAAGAWATESGHHPLKLHTEKLRQQAKKAWTQDRRMLRFERAMALTAEVTRQRDPEALLSAVALAALQMLEAERCFVALTEAHQARPRVVRVEVCEGGVADGEPSWSIVEQVCHQRRPVIAGNIFERGDLRERKSVTAMALRSAVCVPMLDGERLLGVIYVDSKRQGEEEMAELAGLLSSLADHAAIATSHARATAEVAARGRRAAELAHDIRSPLGSAFTLLAELRDEAAARGEEGRRLRELQGLIERATAMARRMLEDKPEERIGVDLGRLVRDTCGPLGRDAARAGQRLRVDAQDGLMALVFPQEVARLVTNLVGNALRYNRIGGQIDVLIALDAVGGLRLRVSDEGPGVPEALLDTLFQWGVKDQGPAGGYGYGLSIVSGIVEGLGGRVTVSNRPEAEGGGACFEVSLPSALRLAS